MHTMHQDLRLFPYEIQISQLETDANKAETCLWEFCRRGSMN